MCKLYRMIFIFSITIVSFCGYLIISSNQVLAEDKFFYESQEGMQFLFDPKDIRVNKDKNLIYTMVTARSRDGRKVPFYCFFSTRENVAVFSTDGKNWLPAEKWNDFHHSLLKAIRDQSGDGSGKKNQFTKSPKPKQPVDVPLDAKTIAHFRSEIDRAGVGNLNFGGEWLFGKYKDCRKVDGWHVHALATSYNRNGIDYNTAIVEIDPLFKRMRFLEIWQDNAMYGNLRRVNESQFSTKWMQSNSTTSPLNKYSEYLLANFDKIPTQN